MTQDTQKQETQNKESDMNIRKFITSGLTALALASGGGCPASDPGKPGKAEHITIYLKDGSVLSKSTWGFWRASNAKPACRWTVKINGQIAAQGGADDAIISGHGLNGGVVHTNGNCGSFAK